MVIQTNVDGRDMGGLVAEIDQRIRQEIDLPVCYSVMFGGQFENHNELKKNL